MMTQNEKILMVTRELDGDDTEMLYYHIGQMYDALLATDNKLKMIRQLLNEEVEI